MPRAGVGGWRKIRKRWGPRRQGGVPEVRGGGVVGLIGGSGFGGNAESLQELPRVSVGAVVPTSGQVYSRAYTCVYTHTKVGIPSTAGLPTCPCGASAWFPWGLWAGSPAPCKMGRQDAGLVPGGVCGWPGGRGWENCLRRRVCSKGRSTPGHSVKSVRPTSAGSPLLVRAGLPVPWAVLVRALAARNALVPACPLRRGLEPGAWG